MVADPVKRQTPEIVTPGYPGEMGQRSYRTIPFTRGQRPPIEDDRRPLSLATQLQARDRCWRCNGQGEIEGEFMGCQVCGRRYSREQVETEGGRFFRNVLLPCGHGIRKNEIVYQHPPCPACYHSPWPGYLSRWPTVEELLPVILEMLPQMAPALVAAIEQYYADLSAKSTAVRAASSSGSTGSTNQGPQSF